MGEKKIIIHVESCDRKMHFGLFSFSLVVFVSPFRCGNPFDCHFVCFFFFKLFVCFFFCFSSKCCYFPITFFKSNFTFAMNVHQKITVYEQLFQKKFFCSFRAIHEPQFLTQFFYKFWIFFFRRITVAKTADHLWFLEKKKKKITAENAMILIWQGKNFFF